MLLIGVADLYLTFNKRFSEITLFPTRPEGQMLFVYDMRQEVTLFPTRPERAEALSPGQRPGFLFWAVACRPVRAKALKLLAIFKAVALTGRIAHCHYTQGAALG